MTMGLLYAVISAVTGISKLSEKVQAFSKEIVEDKQSNSISSKRPTH